MTARFFVLLLTFFSFSSFAQTVKIEGYIKDGINGAPISNASVLFDKNRVGAMSDSAGYYSAVITSFRSDSVIISHVGYLTVRLLMKKGEALINTDVVMMPGASGSDVLIKTKINKGLYLWRKIMSKKEQYDPYNLDNYGYREYNKVIAQVLNFNLNKIKSRVLLAPLNAVLKPLHSITDSAGNLPPYIMECVGDYARQSNPIRTNQHLEACNTKGVPLDNFNDVLRVLKQKINVFNGYVRLMDQDFMSPFNSRANLFYDFSVTDTQIINGARCFHLYFSPRWSGEGMFSGDTWVESGTFRLKNINLSLNQRTKLNFVEGISISQEFTLVQDSFLFIKKETVTGLFSFMGRKTLKLKGTMSNTYSDQIVHSDSIARVFNNQTLKDEVTNDKNYMAVAEKRWDTLRLDTLTQNEKKSYDAVSNFVSGSGYEKLRKNLKFVGTGYAEEGKFDIGKWYSLVSNNQWEGIRFRLDLFTNNKFSEHWYFHNYLAYGTDDRAFKGQSEVYWLPKKYPNMFRLHASWRKDVDNNVRQLGGIAADNLFSLAITKPNRKPKFLSLQETKFDVYKDWKSGLSIQCILSHQQYRTLLNLPTLDNFLAKAGDPLTNFSVGLKIRFSYLDKFVLNDYYKFWLGTRYPELVLIAEKGIPGVFQSKYSYLRLSGSIGDYFSIAPLGGITYNIFGGKIFGTVPYTFLENHPGNDLFYFGDNVFNMMYRFEYLSDQYYGIRFNHTIGPGIFGLIPFTQKLKWRQFWTANVLRGSLSEANRVANRADEYFKTLNGKTYLELGTGVENILRVFRIDFIWRLLPQAAADEKPLRFGVFGSFKFKM